MNILYVPWRKKYAKSIQGKGEKSSHEECPFCIAFLEHNDEKHFIIKRYNHCALMMNLYPYNAGHMMAIPYKHTGKLADLDEETRRELMDVTTHASRVLEEHFDAQGINIGINMGKSAGAGIPAHLHMHILPRWQGDTNFMPLLMDTKIVSFDLHEMYSDLRKHF